jgi:hypothetical protein
MSAVCGLFSKKRIPTGIKPQLKFQMPTGHNPALGIENA